MPAGQRGQSAAPPGPADPATAVAEPTDPPAAGRPAARLVPVALAAVAMLAAGLWGLGRASSMGNDEVATRWAALLPLPQLDHLLRNLDAVHGLYYLIMHGWMAVGTSPTVMRIPSVAAMGAAAAMLAVLARQLTGSGWAGLVAGLIMAVTPTVTYYAQTARSYALVYACVAGATLVLVQALRAEAAGVPGRRLARWWLGYGVLITVAGYLNELSLLIIAAHAVTVTLARYGRRTLAHWAVAAVVSALLVVPLLIVSDREDGAVAWIARPGLGDLRVLFHDYFGATTAVAVILLACAVAAVLPARGRWAALPAPLGTASTPPSGHRGEQWWRGGLSLPSVAAPVLVIPAAVLIAESLVAHPLYVDRYVLFGEAGAALLAAGGAYRAGRWLAQATSRRTLTYAPAAVVCVLALLLQVGPLHRVRTPQSRLFDFGGPSRYVAAHAQRGDGVLFFTGFYRKARLGYPADYQRLSDFALAVSPARAGTFQGQDKPAGQVIQLLSRYQRIWVVGRPPSAETSPGAYRQEARALQADFRQVALRHFRGIVVTEWIPRPAPLPG